MHPTGTLAVVPPETARRFNAPAIREQLRRYGTAFRDPKSYFHRYATLSDAEAVKTATSIWTRINLLNLRENILPTRQRADLILKKVESHLVEEVALRRL